MDEEFLEVCKTHEQLLVNGLLLLRFKNPGFDGILGCPSVIGAAFHFADRPPQNICPALYCVDLAQQIAYLVLHCAQLALSLLRMFLKRFDGALRFLGKGLNSTIQVVGLQKQSKTNGT